MRLVREIEPRDRLRRVTTCEIQEFVGKKWAYYRFGAAQCSHEDQFRKEYARRMSLGRALARVDEDNPFYGKALAAYYGRKKGKAA
jgi:hypothetical protein